MDKINRQRKPEPILVKGIHFALHFQPLFSTEQQRPPFEFETTSKTTRRRPLSDR